MQSTPQRRDDQPASADRSPTPSQHELFAAPKRRGGLPRFADSAVLMAGTRVLVETKRVRALPLFNLIAIRCSHKGLCWPGEGSMADDLGVSVRTVKRRVAELIDVGLVRVTRRRNRSQIYYLTARAGFRLSIVGVPGSRTVDLEMSLRRASEELRWTRDHEREMQATCAEIQRELSLSLTT